MFDVSLRNLDPYVGWVPAPIPDARDDDVDAFVSELCVAGPSAVNAAIDHASQQGRDVLGAFAERMASAAVRLHDRELLVRCLVALVVGGLTQDDREALMVMSVIEDAARQIDAEVTSLFSDAARIVGDPGTTYLLRWQSRAPEDRTIEAMHFVRAQDDDGFRYRPRKYEPLDRRPSADHA
jgi:hypothetical protein